jgi:predicted enzyme related to lactoylglutathione lyase
MSDSEHKALEIHEITFDARDPHELAAFWAALLDREIRPGDMPQDDSVLVVPTPGQPGLLFLRVPEGKTAKNRIHFDLWPTSTQRDEQVERATGLGAAVLDDRRREDGTGWVVFADPEGNEFCIGRSAAERAAKRPPRLLVSNCVLFGDYCGERHSYSRVTYWLAQAGCLKAQACFLSPGKTVQVVQAGGEVAQEGGEHRLVAAGGV